jgi:hypothetical protein
MGSSDELGARRKGGVEEAAGMKRYWHGQPLGTVVGRRKRKGWRRHRQEVRGCCRFD